MVDNLLIFLTSSSTFRLFSKSFFYSCISYYTSPIICFCYYESSIAVFFVFFSYARMVSKYCFYCWRRVRLVSRIYEARDWLMFYMTRLNILYFFYRVHSYTQVHSSASYIFQLRSGTILSQFYVCCLRS